MRKTEKENDSHPVYGDKELRQTVWVEEGIVTNGNGSGDGGSKEMAKVGGEGVNR